MCERTSVYAGKFVKLWIASVKYRNSLYHDVQIIVFDNVKLSELSSFQLWYIVRKVGTSIPMKYSVFISRGEHERPRVDWSIPVDFAAFASSYECVEMDNCDNF